MEYKTIGDLEGRVWYRFCKVVFIVVFMLALFILNWEIYNNCKVYVPVWIGETCYHKYTDFDYFNFTQYFFIGNFLVLLLFEAIRRAFYYIVFGSIKPKK